MTPDTQARAGYRRPPVRPAASGSEARGSAAGSSAAGGQAGGAAVRADRPTAAVRAGHARTGHPGTAAWGAPPPPAPASPLARAPGSRAGQPAYPSRASGRAAHRARADASLVKVIPLLAVMVVTAAGVYIAWQKGSAGGGEGGVVGGAGLLAAAVARLLLPVQLVGLLATRKRALDVITLTVFGTCLLVAGLVLPR